MIDIHHFERYFSEYLYRFHINKKIIEPKPLAMTAEVLPTFFMLPL